MIVTRTNRYQEGIQRELLFVCLLLSFLGYDFVSSTSSISLPIRPPDSSPVTIERYELWYKSGQRDMYQEMFSPRPYMPQLLDDGYYICYEDYGDNIEVILSINNNNSTTNTTLNNNNNSTTSMLSTSSITRIDRVEMILRDRKMNVIVTSRTERVAPYFLYGDNGRLNIFGKTLSNGKYELIVTVYSSTTTTTSTTTAGSSASNGLRVSSNNNSSSVAGSLQKKQKTTTVSIISKTIQLDVIQCEFFHPPNECLWCPSTSGSMPMNVPVVAIGGGGTPTTGSSSKTCLGSSCISTGYFRISLLTIGGNPFTEVTVSVVTPYGTVVSTSSTSSSSGTVTSSDSQTSGYVDENTFNVVSCKEIGIYVKNILFPDPSKVPYGNYTIQLQAIPVCGSADDTNEPTKNTIKKPFELYIYFQNELVASYTNSDGTIFNYQLT